MITIGANINATLCVPQCWRANSPTNMTQASRTSSPSVNFFSVTFNPDTDARTEIAGVSTPSPMTMQAPNSTTTSRAVLNLLCFSRNLFNGEEAAACEDGPYL
ncbi:hypothetical protein V8G54_022037 [Vigna mungo]|uniref:Uncharacterized protein n=1 Tax=Vigna mungo TaxID=3915 RepID=A0AAQ3NGQ5_VIGMU